MIAMTTSSSTKVNARRRILLLVRGKGSIEMTSEKMTGRRVRLIHLNSGIGRRRYLNRLLGKRTEQPSNRGRLVHLPHHQHRSKFAKTCATVFALGLGQKVRGLLKLFRRSVLLAANCEHAVMRIIVQFAAFAFVTHIEAAAMAFWPSVLRYWRGVTPAICLKARLKRLRESKPES
jgi:hypothetical protein